MASKKLVIDSRGYCRTIVPCKKCDRYPCVCCACGGFMNDWHSHASDCIEINSKGGKDYNKEKNQNE